MRWRREGRFRSRRLELVIGCVVLLAATAGSGSAGGRTIRLIGAPVGVAVGAGSVFVLVEDNAGEELLRLDPGTGAVRSTTPLDEVGSDNGGVAVQDGTVWAAAGGRLFRLDATGNVVATVAVGPTATSVFASRSAVWVTRASSRLGQLVRVDPRSNRVVARISMGGGPGSVVSALGSVWVANSGPSSLMRIDPRTNRVVATLLTTRFSTALALARRRLWVAGGNSLVGLDAQGRIVGQLVLPRTVIRIAAHDNDLWGTDDCGCAIGRLLRINLRQGRVSGTMTVGQTPVAVATGYGAVWVANFNDSSLSRIRY